MKKVGIIGGTGYTGSELSRLLCKHPEAELAVLTSRQNAGKKVSDIHTFLKGYSDIEFTEKIEDPGDLDLVFVATPHGVAMNEVPKLMDAGVKVIDLSGDYRLHDAEKYTKWYGHEHTDPENLQKSVYGLPELFRSKIKGSDLVANPGCYATSAILAIAPLVYEGAVEKDIIIDAKSGTSGAGMAPSPRLHHPFCGESIIPYSVGTHRHTPEIEYAVEMFSKNGTDVIMIPQLIPIVRGILSSCYMNSKKDISGDEISKIYEKHYGNEPFVHFVKEPSVRAVVGSNHAHVAAEKLGDKIVAFGVLDNLVKGASGQAVQCMNLMMRYDEKTGLDSPGLGV